MGDLAWKAVAAAAGLDGGIVASKLVDGTWKFLTGREFRSNPIEPGPASSTTAGSRAEGCSGSPDRS